MIIKSSKIKNKSQTPTITQIKSQITINKPKDDTKNITHEKEGSFQQTGTKAQLDKPHQNSPRE